MWNGLVTKHNWQHRWSMACCYFCKTYTSRRRVLIWSSRIASFWNFQINWYKQLGWNRRTTRLGFRWKAVSYGANSAWSSSLVYRLISLYKASPYYIVIERYAWVFFLLQYGELAVLLDRQHCDYSTDARVAVYYRDVRRCYDMIRSIYAF